MRIAQTTPKCTWGYASHLDRKPMRAKFIWRDDWGGRASINSITNRPFISLPEKRGAEWLGAPWLNLRQVLGTVFAEFEASAIDHRRMGPHEDQVRQGAVDCRNPMKAVFSHLPRLEGTSGHLTRIGDAARAAHPSIRVARRVNDELRATPATNGGGFTHSRLSSREDLAHHAAGFAVHGVTYCFRAIWPAKRGYIQPYH